MKGLARHRSAFKRQVTEAVLIKIKEKDGLLNPKGGFNQCALPRIQIAMGDRTWKGAQKEKEIEKARVTYKLENNEEEKYDGKVDSKKEASEKNSADKLKLQKRPKLKAKKSKNVFPKMNLNFLRILSSSLFQKYLR